MNRSELGSNIAAGTSLSTPDAAVAVRPVFATIADALARGETVTIVGFGTFSTRSRAARAGRNPATGEYITIAATRAPAFKPGRALRDAVNREHTSCFRQRGEVGISAIRHTCEYIPSHAHRLNPLARGVLISSNANMLLRQRCAWNRYPRSDSVPCPLTATDVHQPEDRVPWPFHPERMPTDGTHTLHRIDRQNRLGQ